MSQDRRQPYLGGGDLAEEGVYRWGHRQTAGLPGESAEGQLQGQYQPGGVRLGLRDALQPALRGRSGDREAVGQSGAVEGIQIAKANLGNVPSAYANINLSWPPNISRPATYYWKS
jgi:hypothetical protein